MDESALLSFAAVPAARAEAGLDIISPQGAILEPWCAAAAYQYDTGQPACLATVSLPHVLFITRSTLQPGAEQPVRAAGQALQSYTSLSGGTLTDAACVVCRVAFESSHPAAGA